MSVPANDQGCRCADNSGQRPHTTADLVQLPDTWQRPSRASRQCDRHTSALAQTGNWAGPCDRDGLWRGPPEVPADLVGRQTRQAEIVETFDLDPARVVLQNAKASDAPAIVSLLAARQLPVPHEIAWAAQPTWPPIRRPSRPPASALLKVGLSGHGIVARRNVPSFPILLAIRYSILQTSASASPAARSPRQALQAHAGLPSGQLMLAGGSEALRLLSVMSGFARPAASADSTGQAN
jgi:hypothetical protein